MKDFIYNNPTKIYFGRHSLDYLKKELDNYKDTILLVYGGGSIKKIGLYDKVIKILKSKHKKVLELSNVLPNPTYSKLMEGVDLVKANNVDLILAVGGGSVIDLAKGVAASSYSNEEPFTKYWINQQPIDNKVVPVASILTMVGTGSEMNGGSVITHEEKKLKIGRVFPSEVYPKFSILNPLYTLSVSPYQMRSGIFDIFSHLMEQYFSDDDKNVSDDLLEALMKSLIKNSDIACKNPHNYEARSNIMWISTLALNTLFGEGKSQDWQVHNIEHQISAYTNCAHGMGLASISCSYYRHLLPEGEKRLARFAKNVFNIKKKRGELDKDLAIKGIEALSNYIKKHEMFYSLKQLGCTENMLSNIADSVELSSGGYKLLSKNEILEILKESY